MDDDPRLMSITSLLLATKSEEAYIRVADLARNTQVEVETLLEFEQILLEAVQFHLKVHVPFRAIHGFVQEIPGLSKADVKTILNEANTLALQAIYTDAIFLYTPSQIALVCVQRAAKAYRLKPFSDWFSKVFSSRSECRKLIEVMNEIDEMLEVILARSAINDTNTWAHLKHRREQCKNLIRDPTSEIAKQHKCKLEQEREERRLKKHLEVESRSNSMLESLNSAGPNPGETAGDQSAILNTNPIKRRRADATTANANSRSGHA